ncbi:hypothetical protein KEM48_007538 [Puccinia striiformis f. sp. tritici PST-130]|nr:hypothetical protein KEM48_007538 [Puccinia striiformis f. sp. tritici PST-130]
MWESMFPLSIEDGENSDEVPYMPTNNGESSADNVPSMTHNPDTMLIKDGENLDEVPYMPTDNGESLADNVLSMTHNPDTMLIEFWKISELSCGKSPIYFVPRCWHQHLSIGVKGAAEYGGQAIKSQGVHIDGVVKR